MISIAIMAETPEEENAMHVAKDFLEGVRAGASIACGDLAD